MRILLIFIASHMILYTRLYTGVMGRGSDEDPDSDSSIFGRTTIYNFRRPSGILVDDDRHDVEERDRPRGPNNDFYPSTSKTDREVKVSSSGKDKGVKSPSGNGKNSPSTPKNFFKSPTSTVPTSTTTAATKLVTTTQPTKNQGPTSTSTSKPTTTKYPCPPSPMATITTTTMPTNDEDGNRSTNETEAVTAIPLFFPVFYFVPSSTNDTESL